MAAPKTAVAPNRQRTPNTINTVSLFMRLLIESILLSGNQRLRWQRGRVRWNRKYIVLRAILREVIKWIRPLEHQHRQQQHGADKWQQHQAAREAARHQYRHQNKGADGHREHDLKQDIHGELSSVGR